MNLKKIVFILIFLIPLYSCADYKTLESTKKVEKTYFTSNGFALIYEEDHFNNKVVSKKIKNDGIYIMHSTLKRNTPVKIVNPENLKVIETKVYKNANYPKIFNVVISKKIASILSLDLENPYIEFFEIKKNKTFVAKKANTFEEEKNVAEKAPVENIQMDDLSNNKNKIESKAYKKNEYTIVINDFYYEDTALKLKNNLIKKIKAINISIKKINNKKYRLFAGPFRNFNALKTLYISLNNLGFENLNIYRE